MSERFVPIRLILLAAFIGVLSGIASGAFLELLRVASDLQTDHSWLLFFLPIAGALIAWLYAGYGRSTAGGNNLILDQIHETGGYGIPLRLFPLILFSTIATHLFGGSAGREGTAVQMGGAIAAEIARRFRISPAHIRILLMCGISGGFSSVFGTPLAGTVFGMEMLALGGMRYQALIPCLIAALMGDQTIRLLDVHHSQYAITSALPELDFGSIAQVAIAGIAFGLASALFSELTAGFDHLSRRVVSSPIWRTAIGGAIFVGITLLLGTRIYSGLSLPLLTDSFSGADVPTFAFVFKLVLTALTLGVGFKGGEVTPLFVIGATLGVTLAGPLTLSADFLAALGFVAVFAAAANTPIACVVMGAELFSTNGVIYFGIAVFVAYTVSGHRGIYASQRVLTSKHLIESRHTGRQLRER